MGVENNMRLLQVAIFFTAACVASFQPTGESPQDDPYKEFGDFEAFGWMDLMRSGQDNPKGESPQDDPYEDFGDFEAFGWMDLLGLDRVEIASNPTTYFILINSVGGPASVTISDEKAGSAAESFTEEVVNENKASIDSSLDISGLINLFSIKSSTQSHFATMTKTTTNVARSETSAFKSGMTGTWEIGEGQLLMTVAVMKMYVFEDDEGNRKRMILPTGQTTTGVFTADQLQNMILDDSFDRVNQMTAGETIEFHTLDDLEERIAAKNKLARIPKRSFPDEDKYYYIRNTAWPDHLIKQWANGDQEVGCYASGLDDEAKWRFEKHGAGYNITNKVYNGRMAVFTNDWWGDGWGTYHGRRFPDQEWIITDLGEGKVRITNVGTGAKLANWGGDSRDCGGYYGEKADDQIWELIEVE